MDKQIYLIRHGETELNRLGKIQGKVDAPINEMGMRQRDAFFDHYNSVDFDHIYTSKLVRSIQSVQPFIDMGIPHTPYSGLNEIDWGNDDGVYAPEDAKSKFKQITTNWRNGTYTSAMPGGESPLEVKSRQQADWQHIIAKEDEKTILVCMHGRAIRILLTWLLDLPLKEMDNFHHENFCLYLLNFDGNKYTKEKHCDVSHLNGI